MSYAATTNDLPPPGNTSPPDAPPTRLSRFAPFIMPMLTLGIAYGLLFLTLTTRISHSEMMARCVLADESKARIWSVANVEIGLAYFGVFGAMLFYFLKIYRNSISHLRDLSFALAYLFGSFLLDYFCVEMFEPFIAMLVGDALVMTFTLIISRQVWFQRLLGVFVPLIFLTCGIGHFLEGLSYWYQTYHLKCPLDNGHCRYWLRRTGQCVALSGIHSRRGYSYRTDAANGPCRRTGKGSWRTAQSGSREFTPA